MKTARWGLFAIFATALALMCLGPAHIVTWVFIGANALLFCWVSSNRS